MEVHKVRVHPAAARLPQEAQLTWKLAAFAVSAADAGVDADVADMVACRIVDNAAVALAAIDRPPVAAARAMALAHPRRAERPSSGSRHRPPSTRSGRRGRTARRPASSTSTTPSSPPTTRIPATTSRR